MLPRLVLPFPAGTSGPNVFMTPRIWFESSVVIRTSRLRTRRKRAGQHAVEPLHTHLTIEPHLSKMRQTVSIVRVGFVRRHIERRFGMARIDADRRRPLGA